MDKQKQILTEELIGIIQGAVGGCATHWASLIAEEVLKYYQPKIPEGAVVLTREEYEGLKISKDFDYGYHNGERNMTAYYENIRLPEVRKKTAETFAERLKEMAYQSTDWSHGEHPMVVEVDYIDEIAKEFKEEENGKSNKP